MRKDKKKKYIVTGGAGFIGSNLVDLLINEGHEVIIIDNLIAGKKANINPKADFYKLDIVDGKSISKLFDGVDGVFHVAALPRVQASFENPNAFFETNVIGTQNVLMAAKRFGVRRVVYSASSSAYGNAECLPTQEDSKVTAQELNPYSSTKRMGEMLMKDMGKMTGGPETVCLRYFNVYGFRQPLPADASYPLVIGLFLDLLKQGKPLTIVPDGHQRRDLTNVSDVVKANLLAMNSPKVGEGEIINIGTGVNYSIWDIASLILKAPKDVKPEDHLAQGKCVMLPPRRGEARETLAHISKAKELLGWEPLISLEDGLAELI